MAKDISMHVVFKANKQHQALLLPPTLDELIAAPHPVRILSVVLDKVDIAEIIKKYKAGGTSSTIPACC